MFIEFLGLSAFGLYFFLKALYPEDMISIFRQLDKKIILIIFSALFSVAFLSSCRLYKSKGRDKFEEKAPSQINSSFQVSSDLGKEEVGDEGEGKGLMEVGTALVQKNLSGEKLCWIQSSMEPLWEVPTEQPLSVRLVGDGRIEVCYERK